MSIRRVAVCAPKIPYIRGGTEALVAGLVGNLRNRQDLEVESIEIPFRSWPHEAVVRSASLWRMLDIETTETGDPIDLVIGTKFPSYYVWHTNKVVWLIHQFRQVYDWYDSTYAAYNRARPDDYQLVRWIVEQDARALREARAVYTISGVVKNRLRRFLGLDATVLHPPPPLGDGYYCEAYDPLILIVQRLDPTKRTDLLVRALQKVRGDFRAVIVGSGPEEAAVSNLVQECGLDHRVIFAGRVADQDLLDLYARCRMVLYAPFDEDYGFVPVEAFASRKPVITTRDSGGPIEFVDHRENGWIAEPDPDSLAEGIQLVMDNRDLAEKWGTSGTSKTRDLNWKRVTDCLAAYLPPRP